MRWRDLNESWEQARRLGGQAGRALERAVEAEARQAAANAVEGAREAVGAADDDRLGDALGLLSAAGTEATQVMLLAAWPWWYDKRRGGRAA